MNGHLDLFRDMHLTGGIFLDAHFTAPWCITAQVSPEDCAPFTPQPCHIIGYHFVTLGAMRLVVCGQQPINVQAGELVVLPRNDIHLLGSDMNIAPTDISGLIQPGYEGGIAQIVYGNKGAPTHVLCGFLGSNQPRNAVFAMLPPVLKLDVGDAISGSWIESTFRFGAQEQAQKGVQSRAVLARLAELLLMDAVSRYVAAGDSGNQSAWAACFGDVLIGRALNLIHGRMAEHWTTERLAREVGLSRSAFAERFTKAVTEPPMTYLCRQRLEKASFQLRDTATPIPKIAAAIGYESEAAFSRAFKRVYGLPPATWRRRNLPH
ncbi:MAG: AraC family transcriptional regulator [Marinobacter sp.]|uniref:AraC family transcriptional regulator n=1 Tax=Marinobacter sp. TaxID=50741 RepID=UPI003296DB5F